VKRPPVLAHLNYEQARQEMLARAELKEKFRYIHETNLWGSPESISGLGSSEDATREVRIAMESVCREYRITSLLDIPCGDASWIRLADLPIRKYMGGDIVPEIVKQNQKSSESRESGYPKSFLVLDITRDELPRCDLVLCRDCLVHLSLANIRLALRNVVRSGAKYLLTTTFPLHGHNEDIEDGDWRLLNLERAPFCLPKPVAIFNEGCNEAGGAYRDKSLGLWELSQIGIQQLNGCG
jgi:hypothetical protein